MRRRLSQQVRLCFQVQTENFDSHHVKKTVVTTRGVIKSDRDISFSDCIKIANLWRHKSFTFSVSYLHIYLQQSVIVDHSGHYFYTRELHAVVLVFIWEESQTF